MSTDLTTGDIAKDTQETMDRLLGGVRDADAGPQGGERKWIECGRKHGRRVGTVEVAVDFVRDARGP